MANLAVTLRCDRSCPYCFASPALMEGRTQVDMEMELFEELLDWLKRSQVAQLRLLGGEPTLHPSCMEMIRRGVEEGFDVRLFTHGRIPSGLLYSLTSVPPERLGVLVNVTGLEKKDAEGRFLVERALNALGSRATMGYTFQQGSEDPKELLDWIPRFGLNPRMRLGIAQPVFGGNNVSLPPNAYSFTGEALLSLARICRDRGIHLDFDCGLARCIFVCFDREWLDCMGEMPSFHCFPVPDVLPDGNVVPCFALGRWVKMPRLDTVEATREALSRALEPYRSIGAFMECETCSHRQAKACEGGCLAVGLGRLHGADPSRIQCHSPTRTEKEKTPVSRAPFWIPYIDQPISFWEKLADRYQDRIAGVYLPPKNSRIATGRPPQPQEVLDELLSSSLFPLALLLNGPQDISTSKGSRRILLEEIDRLLTTNTIECAVLSNIDAAKFLRARFPDLKLTASVLMDVTTGEEAARLNGLFDALVPSSGVLRNGAALKEIRNSFKGKIRLLVNEGCLRNCPYREEHFREMASGKDDPSTPCESLLTQKPWLSLTGGWVLPQHLWIFEGLYDELKLSGRVTLRNPDRYLQVLEGYMQERFLSPHEIGAGPAAPRSPIWIGSRFFQDTVHCDGRCSECSYCQTYYETWSSPLAYVTNAFQSSKVMATTGIEQPRR